MLHYTKQLFDKITNIGTHYHSDRSQILKIQIMNNVTFVILLMCLVYTVISIYNSEVLYTIINFFAFVAISLSLFLTHKNNIETAWRTMLTIPVLILTLLPLITEIAITAILYYVVCQTLVFALFNRRRVVISFSIFYGINALLFLYFSYRFNTGTYNENFLSTSINLILGLSLEFLILLIVFAIREEQSKAFQLTEATFKSVFENSPIGVIVSHRKEGSPKMVNERMSIIFGYDIDTFSLKRISEITYPADRNVHQPFYEQLLNDEISFFEIEKRYIHKNGNILWCRTAISLVRNDKNEPIYTVAMLQDITKHKEQETKIHQLLKKLKTLNAELAQTVDERTQNLIKTNEDLMRSNQDLEQFAYAASHDLQEPLRMIGNFVQLLDRKYGDKLDENGKTYINFAVEGVTRMSSLIKSLLQYSRVGRKEAEAKAVDIKKIVEHKLLDLDQMIKNRNAIVTIKEIPRNIVCEPVQIGLVFYNLIVNGLKFNKSVQPTITITSKELEEHWCFSVTDNGIGIEDTYKDKIFEIFKRLNRRDEYDGTGIGLALCKKIVYRHKGKIWFDSKLNEGTTFYFTISKDLHQY